LEVAHIFKRSVAAYNSSSDKAKAHDKWLSLSRSCGTKYCRLDPKYLDDMDFMDRPENAISLIHHFHETFDSFLWCLKPTTTPNRYEVKEYDPILTYMYTYPVPAYITFEDHTIEDAVAAAPHPELLRLHAALTGVLRMSGAAGVFELIMDRRGPGNPPVPSADGEAFLKEVMDPEVQELWESVAGMWPTISQ
ncbi:hypothetical protein LXA43DRAFT_903492, partial [Ganoderma leucocontextum]